MQSGELIQITNPEQHWYPCILIVDEVRTWGVVAYALIPHNDGTGTARAFTRLNTADFESLGVAAAIVIGDDLGAAAPLPGHGADGAR